MCATLTNMLWLRDTVERCIRTFLQAWLSAWLVLDDKTFDNLFSEKPLLVGFIAAVGAFLFAIGGAQVGSRDSASFQT